MWNQYLNKYKAWKNRRRLFEKDIPGVVRSHIDTWEHVNLRKDTLEARFVVFDIETTGLRPENGDRIVSIGAVAINRGKIELSDTFYSIVNPCCKISRESILVHTIRPDVTQDHPTIKEVLPEFIGYCGTSPIVAHQIWFDIKFLNAAMKDSFGIIWSGPAIDVIKLSRSLEQIRCPYKDMGRIDNRYSIEHLASTLNIPIYERHSAINDAFITAQIFLVYLKILHKKGHKLLKHLLKMGS